MSSMMLGSSFSIVQRQCATASSSGRSASAGRTPLRVRARMGGLQGMGGVNGGRLITPGDMNPGMMGGGMGGPGMMPGGGGGDDGVVASDPEGLFKGQPLALGIIERRMMDKRKEVDKEFAAAMAVAMDDERKKAMTRRAMRNPPDDVYELIEYFLNTEAEDMQYEVSRCRPKLSTEFFKTLDTLIGQERFAPEGADKERLAELDGLRTYLDTSVKALDDMVETTSSAAERMKALLSAKDKKEHILGMVERNEIDLALMTLLQQNIEAARTAQQEDAAKFMEKIKQALAKYVVVKPMGGAAAAGAEGEGEGAQAAGPMTEATKFMASAKAIDPVIEVEAEEVVKPAAAPARAPGGGVILTPGGADAQPAGEVKKLLFP